MKRATPMRDRGRGPDADLDELVDLAAVHDEPILIETDDGVAVGLVDKKALLRGIQGKPSDG